MEQLTKSVKLIIYQDKKCICKQRKRKTLNHEYKILKYLNEHAKDIVPEIIKYDNDLILSYFEGMDLFDFSQKYYPFNNDAIDILITKLISCVRNIHKIGIYHRDIKPENFIIQFDDKDIICGPDVQTGFWTNNGTSFTNVNIKLIDWEFAENVKTDQEKILISGTFEYVAPEVLSGEYFGPKNDIWSLGIIFYLLIYNIQPMFNDKLITYPERRKEYIPLLESMLCHYSERKCLNEIFDLLPKH